MRVKLTNFVTYTAAEFFPGPSLNMVIGPNGTGKSTLVCAICLGLGSKTDTLGRAKDISDFVKHGAREAEIEIELAADPRQHAANPVIRRIIKKNDDKKASFFFIDDKPVSQKTVLKLCRSFSIQIDNLCQFLPQDRVVEFAALSPVELLGETQRAAAPEVMTERHEQLKTLRKQQKQSMEQRISGSDTLKGLESRQNLQRADVERLRERAEIQEELDAMKKLRPFAQYNEALDVFKAAKQRRRVATRELEDLRLESEPAMRAVHDKEQYVQAVKVVVDQRTRLMTNMENKAADTLAKQQKILDDIKQCESEVTAERDQAKKTKQDRIRLENEIKNIQRQIDTTKPADFDYAALNEETREVQRRQHEKETLADEARRKHDDVFAEIQSRKQRIEVTTRTLEGLRTKAGQQASKLRGLSQDTAAAWDWIQNNRDRFAGKVFGPALLECTLKEQRYAKPVEAAMNKDELLAITVTDPRDFNMLQEELLDGKTMRLNDFRLRVSSRPLASWRPQVPPDQLRNLGLDGYVLDLIEGPEEILSMLCDGRNIHTTAVCFRDMTNEQYEAVSRSPINSWVTATESYQIIRRKEYGDQGTSTRTIRLRDPRFFTSQPVDVQQEERLKNEKLELQDQMQELKEQLDGHKADQSRYDTQITEIKAQRQEMENEKKARQNAQSSYKALTPRLEGVKRKLEKVLQDAASYRTRVQEIKDKQEDLVLKRAEEALKLMSVIVSAQKLQTELVEAEVWLIEAQSEREVLHVRNQEVRLQLRQREQEVATLATQSQSMKAIAQRWLNECNAILAQELNPREVALHQSLTATDRKYPADWEADIEATAARLEMVHEGNPRILQEYEERAREIERLRRKLLTLDRELADYDDQITDVRQQWEPELDALVGSISDAFGENFARIGCAGQVTVFKDEENFENWAINIEVKFRYVFEPGGFFFLAFWGLKQVSILLFFFF